jgi:hypothetical protein
MGLRRFGLPELRTLSTPPDLVDAWSRAMMGLAGRLIADWRDALASASDAAFVHMRPSLVLHDSDVVEALSRTLDRYGPRASGDSPAQATVRLVLDPHQDPHPYRSYLTVHPPLSWPRTTGEFLADACRVLFGPSPSDTRRSLS